MTMGNAGEAFRKWQVIGERIKRVRRSVGMTSATFARETGTSTLNIDLIENLPHCDKTLLQEPETLASEMKWDELLKRVYHRFVISEEWLRTGEEPMELPMMSTLLADANIGEDDRVIIQMYLELPVEKRQILKDYILNVAAELSTIKQPADSSMDTSETAPPMTSREEAHRLVDKQYDAIERGSHTV